VERFIEIGPQAVLCRMAKGTAQVKYESSDTANSTVRTYLCSSKERKEIYYEFEDEPEEDEVQPSPSTNTTNSSSAATVMAAPAFIASTNQTRQSAQIE
jgi:fatty acid synthase subunit alpha, fungi type